MISMASSCHRPGVPRYPHALRLLRTLGALSTATALVLSGCGESRQFPSAVPPVASAPAGERRGGSVGTGTPTAPVRWNFDADPLGGLPAGAMALSGTWGVRAEPDAPSPPDALCQTGEAEYPALVLGESVSADVVLSTRFKPITGRTDQAAGLLFRIQDKDNYYILRANALEGNVNLYRYAGGRRSTLKEGAARVVAGQWQELRAEAVGNRFRGFFNGQLVVETTDGAYTAGRVGLWTKADSVTCFDDVEARLP